MLARVQAPRMGREHAQQRPFLGREQQGAARIAHYLAGQVDLQRAQAQHRVLPGLHAAAAPAHGAQPGQQFLGVIGFDQVVVSPRVQPADAVAHLVAGRQHDGDGRLLQPAQRGHERQAIAVGQVQVQQHGRVAGAGQAGARLGQRGHAVDQKGLGAQIAAHRLGQCLIVFDQQDSHGRLGLCTSGCAPGTGATEGTGGVQAERSLNAGFRCS